ncbi:hypothetical protein, partial [Dactylosporangium sp. NPDC006015]|uniref:hypothetical protein n=1 Tax=Dactylosporangium sp. NPDC006015 TaxID=3154576 RepID=UPI0033BB7F33
MSRRRVVYRRLVVVLPLSRRRRGSPRLPSPVVGPLVAVRSIVSRRRVACRRLVVVLPLSRRRRGSPRLPSPVVGPLVAVR